MLTATEYAYIAGIMDGEGSISIDQKFNVRGSSATYGLSVSVTNTNRALLDWIRAKTRLGQVTPKPRTNKKWKPCFQLILSVSEIKPFLQPLIQYMIVRRSHAELMLEFLTYEWKQTGTQKTKPQDIAVMQDILFEELLALNKRGV